MFSKVISLLAVNLLTEKVIVKLTLSCADYLVKKTENKLDDDLYETIKGALE